MNAAAEKTDAQKSTAFEGRAFFRGKGQGAGLLAAAAGAEQVAQSALFAGAVRHGENERQVAAVEYVAQDPALRAADDEQKDEDPQASVIAAESSEKIH